MYGLGRDIDAKRNEQNRSIVERNQCDGAVTVVCVTLDISVGAAQILIKTFPPLSGGPSFWTDEQSQIEKQCVDFGVLQRDKERCDARLQSLRLPTDNGWESWE
jgi:hypothetical protein